MSDPISRGRKVPVPGKALPRPGAGKNPMKIEKRKDVWQLMNEKHEEEAKNQASASENENAAQPVGRSGMAEDEYTTFFVGSAQGGKSTLISRFLEKDDTSAKSTIALEYSFGRKPRSTGVGKDVTHIWELGGGTKMKSLVEVPLTSITLARCLVVIILDLSQSSEVLPSLSTFLKLVRDRTTECLRELEKSDPALSKTILDKQLSSFEEHADRSVLCPGNVPPSVVPIVLIGTKWDKFQTQDAEAKKIMARTLRFIAHTTGASLLYTSSKEEALTQRYRLMLNHYAFRGPVPQTCVVDHLKPLFIPAGRDTLAGIGDPPVFKRDAKTPLDLWRASFETIFPPKTGGKEDPSTSSELDSPDFAEPDVDAARGQKDEELERYKKSQERLAKGLKEIV